jgi:hypothetical protein
MDGLSYKKIYHALIHGLSNYDFHRYDLNDSFTSTAALEE